MKTEGLLAANRGLKTRKCKKRCRKSCRANLETHYRNRLVAVIVFARSGRETIHLLTVLSRSHTAHALEQGVEMSIFMVPNHMGNLQHRFIGAAQQFFGAVDPLFRNNIGIGFSRLLAAQGGHIAGIEIKAGCQIADADIFCIVEINIMHNAPHQTAAFIRSVIPVLGRMKL